MYFLNVEKLRQSPYKNLCHVTREDLYRGNGRQTLGDAVVDNGSVQLPMGENLLQSWESRCVVCIHSIHHLHNTFICQRSGISTLDCFGEQRLGKFVKKEQTERDIYRSKFNLSG